MTESITERTIESLEDMIKEEPMMKYFSYQHLPKEHLREASKPFYMLAENIVTTIPRNAERTVALRKLLEAKDCAVRAVL